jgi:Spy/CpxP family protein refolding chaperone
VQAKADLKLHGRPPFTLLYPARTLFNPAGISNARQVRLSNPRGAITHCRKPGAMKMRKTLLSLFTAAAIGGSTLALAAGAAGMGHGWQGHHHRAMTMRALHKLNLSDAQRDQIKQLAKQNFEQLKPQAQAVRQQRKAFESMEPIAPGYQAAAKNLAEAEASLARARVLQRAALRAQVYNLLTPAQRTQMVAMRAQREARMQQWKAFKAQHPLPDRNASSQQ